MLVQVTSNVASFITLPCLEHFSTCRLRFRKKLRMLFGSGYRSFDCFEQKGM